jgi:hypothetical protein
MAPRGAAPQAPQQGQNKPKTRDIELFRKSPDIKQAITLFVGREIPMETVPDEILKEVAGMVAKLGVQGAVAMAEKMLPPEIKTQLKQGGQPQAGQAR